MRTLWSKNFFLLWQGQFVSQLGTQAFMFAAMFWVMDETASSSMMGVFVFATMLPQIIFAPLGGVFADRNCKRTILVVTDLIAALLMVSVALVFYFDLSDTVKLVSVFAGGFGVSWLNAYFQPAVLSLIPNIVDTKNCSAANSMIKGTEQLAKTLGYVFGGVIYAIVGLPLLVAINAFSFVFSAISEKFIVKDPPAIESEGKSTFRTDFLAGGKYLGADGKLRTFFVLVLLFNFIYAPFWVLMPLLAKSKGYDSAGFGFLMMFYTSGQLAAFLISQAKSIRSNCRFFLNSSWLLCSFTYMALVGQVGSIELSLLLFFQGLAIGLINILLINILQIYVPSDLRGRVFGFLQLVSGAALPAGVLIAGYVAESDIEKIQFIFTICGAVMLLISVCFVLINDNYRAFMAQANQLMKEQ